MTCTLTHIGTACLIIDLNGFRILTDPVFDEAGGFYHFGFGAFSRKTEGPFCTPADIGNIDLVLLSHHQHQDNLDQKGKEFIRQVRQVISTKAAASVYPNVTGLDPWESVAIVTDRVPELKITATPAQHHPGWLPRFFSGHVIGFLVEYADQEAGALYISGDTVYFSGMEEIARRFQIGLAVLHLGAVQFRYLTGPGRFTLNAVEAMKTIRHMNPRVVVPIHTDGWSHFKEGREKVRKRFTALDPKTRIVWLEKGRETPIDFRAS